MTPTDDNAAFESILNFIKNNRGFDFTAYKHNSLERRIRRRMDTVGIHDFTEYEAFLAKHPEEFSELFNTILINVTSFFRDPSAWQYLQTEVIPQIVKNKLPGEPIRVWTAGCASGEETYTLVMVMVEILGKETSLDRVKVYATDIDEEALNHARAGIYTDKDVASIPPELLSQYFDCDGNRYILHKDFRRAVIFGRQDLIQDAPISHIDLLICRNVLMYFTAEAQSRVLSRLHFSLNDNGYLFLGKAEMLLTHANIFAPMDLPMRIFTRISKGSVRDRLALMSPGNDSKTGNHQLSQVRMRNAAFEAGPTGQIVIDNQGILVLANAKARDQFGLATSDLGHPFRDFQLSYRPAELRSVIDQVVTGKVAILQRDIEWINTAGEARVLEVSVSPVSDDGVGILGVSIAFSDITTQKRLQVQLENTNQDLETAMEELQSTNEELETTNEELQSTIEELETTNEELQSTNEELETMNEELQSTNEELETMNNELRINTDNLILANEYLESILSSMRGGVMVLDDELRIQVWNGKSEDLWGLRAQEVHGSVLLNLDIGLPTEPLIKPLRAILSGESNFREIVVDAINRRGKQITCNVSLSPLMDLGQHIIGVILVASPKEA